MADTSWGGPPVPGRFDGKTILITGAAGDIGLATAGRFAQEGADLALADLDQDALRRAEATLREVGPRNLRCYPCDVTDEKAVVQLTEQAARELDGIDLLFNNAGYQGEFAQTHRFPAQDFRKILEVNVTGAFLVLREVTAHMAERGGGAVVNTASMAGVEGPPNMLGYGASKGAVITMTMTAAKDLAPLGIRVNAISPAYMGPGYMWDRQTRKQAEAGSQYFPADPSAVGDQMIESIPMRRCGRIEEIPGTVAFLMSPDASYITGVNIPIAGGIG